MIDILEQLLSPYEATVQGREISMPRDPVYGTLEDLARPQRTQMQSPTAGPGGDVLEQLRAGFLAAGRPDLADMVGRRSFDTWVDQESGWDEDIVSPANNQGLPNGGLFQFWYGHDFSNGAEGANSFNASPYQQAIWAATQFGLDPKDIRGYARSINNGTYGGWG